jgi:2-keto-3-deoxy-L-rhamnonate aldolase RhmA
MRTNWVREKLRAGKPSIGSFMGLGSPNVAGLLAYAGFDWLIIEMEHNGLDMAQVETILMAMSGTDAIPIVRVPSTDHVFIQRSLDIGAMGIVVPLLRTAEEAEAVVRATRYPPQGSRSFGPLRASNYALDYPDYMARANDNILVGFILETPEALENLEEIADVEGIDFIFLGLFDLCLLYGLNPLHMPFPEIDAAVQRALKVGREHNIAVGIGVTTPDALRRREAEGFCFLSYGSDYQMLADSARAGVSAFEAISSDER